MVNHDAILDVLGLIGSFVISAALVPQIQKVYRTKSANDFSYSFMCLYVGGLTLVTIYGAGKSLWPIWIPVSIELVGAVILLSLKIMFDRQKTTDDVEDQRQQLKDEHYARSRGLCKAHGGGKRCKVEGCNLSDQGGGHCIRHGGGKRCEMEGCPKSAQSRRFCKAHGGGARCKVEGCGKTSQGGGLCHKDADGRMQPLRQQSLPTAAMVDNIECERGASALSFKIRAATEPKVSRSKPAIDPVSLWMKIQEQRHKGDRSAANVHHAAPSSSTTDKTASTSSASTAAKDGVDPVALLMTIQQHEVKRESKAPSPVVDGVPQPEAEVEAAVDARCRIGGCQNAVVAHDPSGLCAEHRAQLMVAASLLGMQAAAN
ncbi:hypothetical protein P43SY_001321 [Pythium insidiosum]|uniref:WRKY19-like zinc finger domain-containing protein n=1 Tax=Pythium insidiosum TaxID=114742 RepID=A0AAD5Q958_PYTIN|nr:hypothetical protein P43SY_001321 [Pythium insidiosum]